MQLSIKSVYLIGVLNDYDSNLLYLLVYNQPMELFQGTFWDTLEDSLLTLLNSQAAIAPIFLLALEEMGIPLPVPGDLIIAYTGYQVDRGVISYPIAFALLLITVLTGSSILFFLSRKYGQYLVLKVGKYIHVDEKKLVTVEEKFKRYGPLVIIIGRHIPGFRIPITVFAGISGVNYPTFLVSTFISVVFWILIYLSLGERLGKRTLRLFHAHNFQFLFVLLPLIMLIALVVYLHGKRRKTKPAI